MNNEIVTFEIAKAANEKGFNDNTVGFFYKKELCNINIGKFSSYNCCYNNPIPFEYKDRDYIISAPTYH